MNRTRDGVDNDLRQDAKTTASANQFCHVMRETYSGVGTAGVSNSTGALYGFSSMPPWIAIDRRFAAKPSLTPPIGFTMPESGDEYEATFHRLQYGRGCLGIYRLEEDTLTLCLSPVYGGRAMRPTKFSPAGLRGSMYVFHRTKEEAGEERKP